ncbi:MAG: arylsulfatase [Planctomycetales bacterium]|nr:arylsulfatase [Planctomycetales bacterium]
MNKMHIIRTITAILLFALPATLTMADEPAQKPNIVFVLIDDLGYADCGFNGGDEIRTPNIDKLAHSGAILESHYVQPVCSPTRAALMTGRYATRTGVYTIVRPKAQWGLPLQERTLANALHDAGYETAITGKWHLGEFDPAYVPTSRGFDHQYGHYFGAIDYFTHLRDGSYDWYRDDKELREEGYSTHLIAKEACRLITAKDKTKPIFLYVPFNGVHSPMQVPDSYLQPYPGMSGPRQKLAGMLAAVDEAIGQIVESLETVGLRENTLIVFSSDNGGPRPGKNTPLRDFKGSIYEGGVRGCAFANWPGKIPAGQRITEPMHVIDWYPTLVKLAEGSLDQKLPIDGMDVWPMLTTQAASPHNAILSVQSPTKAAVRMGDWKLISQAPSVNAPARAARAKTRVKNRQQGAETIQLYNLATDIGEATNLAEKDPERVATMKAMLDVLLKDAVPSGAPAENEGE